MITAQSDDTRQSLAGLADARLVGGCGRSTGQKQIVAFFDLLKCVVVVVRCDGDVAAVDDFAPEIEGVCVHGTGCMLEAVGWLMGWETLTHCTRH
jgi:hypothetical protein